MNKYTDRKNILLLMGSVPGPKNSLVKIRTSIMFPNIKKEISIVNYKDSKNSVIMNDNLEEINSVENNIQEQE